jgi:hypothetical protein
MEAALRQAATDHHATLTAQDVAVARASEAAADVLGMTDKRTLVFDERATRDADDSIVFWGNDGDTRVRFRISREALGDHFSKSDRLRPDAAFKKHRREIEGLARRKYLLGRKEPDGTVLIKTLDIAG